MAISPHSPLVRFPFADGLARCLQNFSWGSLIPRRPHDFGSDTIQFASRGSVFCPLRHELLVGRLVSYMEGRRYITCLRRPNSPDCIMRVLSAVIRFALYEIWKIKRISTAAERMLTYLMLVLVEDADLQFCMCPAKYLWACPERRTPPHRYVSTEYLFDVLFTSLANQHATYGYSVSLAAGRHSYLRVFYYSSYILDEYSSRMNESIMDAENNIFLLYRINKWTIFHILTRNAIGKLMDNCPKSVPLLLV